jgi:hypothetical protein
LKSIGFFKIFEKNNLYQKEDTPSKQATFSASFLYIVVYHPLNFYLNKNMCCCGIINTSEIGIIESWGKFARVSDVKISFSFLHISYEFLFFILGWLLLFNVSS